MDWSTLISLAAVLVFLWLMMRGCGGMMAGGGCGMGRHAHGGTGTHDHTTHDHDRRRQDDGEPTRR